MNKVLNLIVISNLQWVSCFSNCNGGQNFWQIGQFANTILHLQQSCLYKVIQWRRLLAIRKSPCTAEMTIKMSECIMLLVWKSAIHPVNKTWFLVYSRVMSANGLDGERPSQRKWSRQMALTANWLKNETSVSGLPSVMCAYHVRGHMSLRLKSSLIALTT